MVGAVLELRGVYAFSGIVLSAHSAAVCTVMITLLCMEYIQSLLLASQARDVPSLVVFSTKLRLLLKFRQDSHPMSHIRWDWRSRCLMFISSLVLASRKISSHPMLAGDVFAVPPQTGVCWVWVLLGEDLDMVLNK